MEKSPSGLFVAARVVGDPEELSWSQTVQSVQSYDPKTDRHTCHLWWGAAQVRHIQFKFCKVEVRDHTLRV
jgi:hypothetical protein